MTYFFDWRKCVVVVVVALYCMAIIDPVRGGVLRGHETDPDQLHRDLFYIRDSSGSRESFDSAIELSSSSDNINNGGPLDISLSGPFLDPEEIVIDDRHNTSNYDGENKTIEFENLSDLISKRIVGGAAANPHKFFAMLLHNDGKGWKWAGCGATLVSNCHVVSAAHCVLDRDIDVKGVYVNAYKPFEGNDGNKYHFSEIDRVITRGDYDDDSNVADISIIRMRDCLEISDFPIAEPVSPIFQMQDGEMMNILGFGKMSEAATSLNRVRHIRKAGIPYISRQSCADDYYQEYILPDMVCAGFEDGGVDACQGDSGSGLMYDDPTDGIWKFVGVVSWGVGCGRSGRPGVYSSIQYYFYWLWEEICLDSGIDSSVSWCRLTFLNQGGSTRQHTSGNRPRPLTPPPTYHSPTSTPPTASPCIAAHEVCETASDCCSGECRVFPYETQQRCAPPLDEVRETYAAQQGRGGARGNQGGA